MRRENEFVAGGVSKFLKSLRDKREGVTNKYAELKARNEGKELSEWSSADRADLEDLHGKLRDNEAAIDFEVAMERAEREKQMAKDDLIISQTTDHGGRSGRSSGPSKRQYDAVTERLIGAYEMGLRNADLREVRQQSADILGEGGYLLTPQMIIDGILRKVDDDLVISGLATVFNGVPATGMGRVREDNPINEPEWGTEVSEAPETEAKFGLRELKPIEHKLIVKVTEKLLANQNIDILSYLEGRIAYKYGTAAEKMYMTGNGVDRGLGIFTASDDGIATTDDVETSTSGQFKPDDLIDVVHSLKAGYLGNSTWVLHRLILKEIRKMKTSGGDYVWQPDGMVGKAVVGGNPATIAGRPYVVSEFAPSTLAASQYIAILGDFSYFYIARGEALKIKVLDQLYANQFKVGYRCLASEDAMPAMSEAFKRVKVKA